LLSLIVPDWPAPSNVFAYTSTRQGGESTGVYAGCNVGLHVGDNASHVLANRAGLPESDRLVWLNQVHGNTVVVLDATSLALETGATEADASLSRTPDVACAIMTADCVPVLLTNKAGTEVAAVHAGWQGLDSQIIAETVKRLHACSQDLLAWIGPAISQACYEVPDSLASRFAQYDGVIKPAGVDGKSLLDLAGIAAKQLAACGVEHVVNSGLCTYRDETRFFSHRRATHQRHQTTGRMVSVIGMRAIEPS